MPKEIKKKSGTPHEIKKISGSPHEISMIYGIPEGSLANMRCKKVGPKYYRVGRKIIYFFSDAENFIRANPVLTLDSIE
ncbi:MAG: hypothetical protein ABFD82_07830 [Syntrophaceae bacterium]